MIKLINAKEMNKLHPNTFWVPSDEQLNSIGIGDLVKVSDGIERFRVKVSKIDGDNITGNVADLIFVSTNFQLDDKITLKKENVYDLGVENIL